MRGMSKAAKAEGYDRVMKRADLCELALHDVMNDQVRWGKWVNEAGSSGKHSCGISRANTRGLLITTFRYPGQTDIVNVEWFDEGYQRITRGLGLTAGYDAIHRAMHSAMDAWFEATGVAAA